MVSEALHSHALYTYIYEYSNIIEPRDETLISDIVNIDVVILICAVGGLTGSQVGLAVTNALLLTGMFQWGVRQAAEIESHMTSVERVLEYCSLVPEAPSETKPECRPPKGWPNAGI